MTDTELVDYIKLVLGDKIGLTMYEAEAGRRFEYGLKQWNDFMLLQRGLALQDIRALVREAGRE